MSTKANPKTRQTFISDILTANPDAIYIDVFREYSENFAVSRRTFDKDWKKATHKHKERQQAINEAKEAAIIAEEVKAAKNGLKTKIDRLMNLQRQVDATLAELEKGTTTETKISGGKASSIERPMTVLERTQLRRSLKDLQSEISRIEGDYSPDRIDHTTGGKPFQGFGFLDNIALQEEE